MPAELLPDRPIAAMFDARDKEHRAIVRLLVHHFTGDRPELQGCLTVGALAQSTAQELTAIPGIDEGRVGEIARLLERSGNPAREAGHPRRYPASTPLHVALAVPGHDGLRQAVCQVIAKQAGVWWHHVSVEDFLTYSSSDASPGNQVEAIIDDAMELMSNDGHPIVALLPPHAVREHVAAVQHQMQAVLSESGAAFSGDLLASQAVHGRRGVPRGTRRQSVGTAAPSPIARARSNMPLPAETPMSMAFPTATGKALRILNLIQRALQLSPLQPDPMSRSIPRPGSEHRETTIGEVAGRTYGELAQIKGISRDALDLFAQGMEALGHPLRSPDEALRYPPTARLAPALLPIAPQRDRRDFLTVLCTKIGEALGKEPVDVTVSDFVALRSTDLVSAVIAEAGASPAHPAPSRQMLQRMQEIEAEAPRHDAPLAAEDAAQSIREGADQLRRAIGDVQQRLDGSPLSAKAVAALAALVESARAATQALELDASRLDTPRPVQKPTTSPTKGMHL